LIDPSGGVSGCQQQISVISKVFRTDAARKPPRKAALVRKFIQVSSSEADRLLYLFRELLREDVGRMGSAISGLNTEANSDNTTSGPGVFSLLALPTRVGFDGPCQTVYLSTLF